MSDLRVAVGNHPQHPGTLPQWAPAGASPWSLAADGEALGYLVAKRALDVFLAGIALILLSPFFALIALAIRLEGPGPILYRQERIGHRARRFFMFKFRTMRPDRRGTQHEIEFVDRRISFKTERDPRVTAVGWWLRRTSIDELPQLINVLHGEMSLVGPRPEQPEMLRYYKPQHYQRHLLVPGLTGWWQINARCRRGDCVDPEEDLQEKLSDDLYYIEHRSFWFDLRILLMTIAVVIARRGAI